MLDDDRSSRPLTISAQLRAADDSGNVIELSNYQPQPYPPQWQRQEPDESERLAAEAEQQLRLLQSQACLLQGIGLAILAVRAELKAGRDR